MDHRGEGGGEREPRGEWRGENGRRGRAEIGRKIGTKKPSEGKKASEREDGWAYGQTEIRQRGSVWIHQKIGKGSTGECSAQSGIGRCAREVTTHGIGVTKPYR